MRRPFFFVRLIYFTILNTVMSSVVVFRKCRPRPWAASGRSDTMRQKSRCLRARTLPEVALARDRTPSVWRSSSGLTKCVKQMCVVSIILRHVWHRVHIFFYS